MNALNKCLMEFLSSHISKDASCNLVPVFDNYTRHVSDITAQCSDQADTQPSPVVTPSAASSASVTAGQHYQPTQQLSLSEFASLLTNEKLRTSLSYISMLLQVLLRSTEKKELLCDIVAYRTRADS